MYDQMTANLVKEIAELRKDAERYRKWRADYTGGKTTDMLLALSDAWTPEEVDAVFDEAMAPKPTPQVSGLTECAACVTPLVCARDQRCLRKPTGDAA